MGVRFTKHYTIIADPAPRKIDVFYEVPWYVRLWMWLRTVIR